MSTWLWIVASLISGFSWGFLVCFFWWVRPMARLLGWENELDDYDPDKPLTSL